MRQQAIYVESHIYPHFIMIDKEVGGGVFAFMDGKCFNRN